jgi:hypothetical protein
MCARGCRQGDPQMRSTVLITALGSALEKSVPRGHCDTDRTHWVVNDKWHVVI